MVDIQNIPDEWSEKTIGDVCEYIQRGKQPEYDDEDGRVKIINQRCIYWDGLKLENTRKLDRSSEGDWQEYRYIQQGDVLVNSTGVGTLGRVQIWDVESDDDYVVDGHVTILRSNDKVRPEYLFRFLSSPLGQNQIEKYTKGATGQTELYKKHIKDIELPVPPLKEQERIVEVVEERLTRLNRLQKSVQMVNELTLEYEKSLLSFLTIGKDVTEESAVDGIPEKQSLPVGWDASQLSEVTNVNPRISHNEQEDYAYVPMDAVSADEKAITRYERRESLYSGLAKFCEGDIILARITPCFENGKMAMASDLPDSYDFAVGSTEFVVIRPTNINPEYLFLYLKSPIVRQWGKHRLLGATGRERIKISQFRDELTVPVPPEETQSRIVQKIKQNDFNKIRMSVNAVQNMFREYEDSVLAHATKGKI